MNEYQIQCWRYGDSLLEVIKTEYPTKLQSVYIGTDRIWSCFQLCQRMQISWHFFNDIALLLESEGYVRLVNDGIELTRKGRVYLIKGGFGFQNQQTVTYNVAPLIIKHIRFKPMELSKKQYTLLIEKISQQNAVNDAAKFVEFLNGDNDGEGIIVAKDGAQFISYLLFILYKKGKIKLTYGKGYRRYVESKIFAFSPGLEKAKMKNLIDGVNKSDYLKRRLAKACDTIDTLLSK